MGYDFEFNGITASDYKIHVEKRPSIPGKKEKIDYIEIAGREETVADRKKFYEDVEIEVECSFKEMQKDWIQKVREIKRWLRGSGELKFTDSADSFWKVKEIEIDGFERPLRKYGIFQVLFICSPFEYLVEGQMKMDIKEASYNPYEVSHPIYHITGEGYCILIVNGKTMNANVGQNLTIDTERMLAYREDGTLQNTQVTGDYEDLYLQPGENTITITSGFDLKIVPNWRRL
mgnify:FL=1